MISTSNTIGKPQNGFTKKEECGNTKVCRKKEPFKKFCATAYSSLKRNIMEVSIKLKH
jgi:hypothetical protein